MQLHAVDSKARDRAPSKVHLKEANCDGYLVSQPLAMT
jgi:hypothetical protein